MKGNIMNNVIKTTGKNCLSIFIIALVAMMFYVTNSNSQTTAITVVNIRAAVEGIYNINSGDLSKDIEAFTYLRNIEYPYEIVSTAKATIHKETMEGKFVFNFVPTGQYYIVLKSSNTIETWSRKGGEFIVSNTESNYDFSSGKDKAFADNLKLENNSKHALIFTGDVNQDDYVNAKDLAQIEKYVIKNMKGNFIEDLNGDGIVNNTDYKIAYKSAMNNVQAMTPMNMSVYSDIIPSAIVRVKALVEGLCMNNPNIGMRTDPYVTVELRNVSPPHDIVASSSGYIDKYSLYGYFSFLRLIPGKYYIVLKSKNTIETWSRNGGEDILFEKLTYDFTAGKEMAFGENMHMCGSYSCLYSGDVNQDGCINDLDLTAVKEDMNKKGNLATDLNGDQYVDNLDMDIVYTNYEKKIISMSPPNISRTVVVDIQAGFEGLMNYDPSDGYFSKDVNVAVLLRNAKSPYDIVGKAKGLIDGSTLRGTFVFQGIESGEYYIVLKTGNTIETWSKKGGETILSGDRISYDFTAGKEMAYGDNMYMMGKYSCIYTGDVDQNGFVDKYDVDAVLNDIGKIKGVSVNDLNGDLVVNKLDYLIVHNNYINFVRSMTPMNFEDPSSTKDAANGSFILKQNSPNPFNPSTLIALKLLNVSNVKLSIYDMSGRMVEQLVNNVLTPGDYTFKWNAGNYASGTYFYRLNVNGEERTMKMQLIK